MRGKYYVYYRTAQGSRLGPFSWGAEIALSDRLAQPLFLRPHRSRSQAKKDSSFSLLLRTYVDDPLATVSGTKAARDTDIAILVAVWLAQGYDLTYPKAQRARTVEWIGGVLKVYRDRVEVWISPDKAEEIRDITREFLSKNLVPLKELRSYAGKCSFVSSLIQTWRPFLDQLWGALKSANTDRSGGAPANTVWTSQIRAALLWIEAFLDEERNEDFCWDEKGTFIGLRRVWRLEAYLNQGPVVRITWDASPYGLGAILEIDDVVIAFIAAPLTPLDTALFGFALGDSAGQQTWEALAPLCALRAWRPYWRHCRVRLGARGDNVGSLHLMMELKIRGDGPSKVARELALELGDGAYAPEITEHIPGLSNIDADILSRKYDPSKAPWESPAFVSGVEETVLPPRPRSYYRSMGPPHRSAHDKSWERRRKEEKKKR